MVKSPLDPVSGWDHGDLACSGLALTPIPAIGKVLVTGGTGYIGGRLAFELLARRYNVRVMVRAPSPEHKERWPRADIVVADALDPASLRVALRGVHTAYYLIHSLLLGPARFAEADIRSARSFREAAEAEEVKRLVYLGGLGDLHAHLSPHLRGRAEVAEVLCDGPIPTTVLRAAVIIGSGSASYEIIKHLVSRAPVILLPSWATTRCQPIAVRDVVRYLVGALEVEGMTGRSFDLGGADVLTYEEMLRIQAELSGCRRLFVRVPFGSIRAYSYLVSLLTPVPAPITACLMEGIKDDVVCQDDEIRRLLPFVPLSYKEAIVRAMSREDQDKVHTRWSDAYPPAHELAIKLHELGGNVRYTCACSLDTSKPAATLFESICRIGGSEGWFHSNWLWRLRGGIDRALIGVGAARGRRSASTLRVNDVIDFWRVEVLRRNERLLLRAEMRMPGWAWLEFRITPVGERNRLTVQAYYETRTRLGRIYWYAFLPFHHFIFTNLVSQIEKRS